MRSWSLEARLVAAAALLVLAAPLGAQPTASTAPRAGSSKIDLNGLLNGTVVSGQYAPGVTVSGGLCATTLLAGYFGWDPVQAINFSYANAANGYTCNGSYGQAITFTFSQAIDSFGFLALAGGGDITFVTPNGSSSQSTPHYSSQYYGITDVTPFTSVQVSVAGDGLFTLDDVTYTSVYQTTTTPEPASFVLFATGALGMFGVARRRNSRAS
jgi:hypothetical protein